ncbi:MAG: hypothetical protein KGP01_01205 [Actinomycetales bacterium]|nr:hypothetical protein [Actinomycetales bacterium]
MTAAERRAVRRDRRVFASHPVAFLLLSAASRRPYLRLGRTIIVNHPDLLREILTTVAMDRQAAGTTGAQMLAATGATSGVPFADTDRTVRRVSGGRLSADALAALSRQWSPQFDTAAGRLARGEEVDVTRLARRIAAANARSILGIRAGDDELIDPILKASAESVAGQLRAMNPIRAAIADDRASQAHVNAVTDLMKPAGPGLLADLAAAGVPPAEAAAAGVAFATAAIATTIASIPRAVAMLADLGLWAEAARDPDTTAAEMLRVTAPTGVIPRVAAADARVSVEAGSINVRAGDRLVLMTRTASRWARPLPSLAAPADPSQSMLVFGAGSHVCPGSRLARNQLAATVTALAPFTPRVTLAEPERYAALPHWRRLLVRASQQPATTEPQT